MAEKRIIKRYTNRKLYDKLESRYVTLEEIARLVREGEDVAVIDNETEEDLTAVTFAQIILEEEKRKTNFISVPFLRKLIRSGEARMQDFSDRATRSIEALGDLTEKAGERVREVVEGSGRAIGDGRAFLDELLEMPQKQIEAVRERAKRSVDKMRLNPTVQKELERVVSSLRTLEEAIARISEEGRRQQSEDRARATDRDSDESESNGYATPAGTIDSVQADDEHQPFEDPDESAEKKERAVGRDTK
jgi:polyhydroxyalkanoate synthesis repressor PhaR